MTWDERRHCGSRGHGTAGGAARERVSELELISSLGEVHICSTLMPELMPLCVDFPHLSSNPSTVEGAAIT